MLPLRQTLQSITKAKLIPVMLTCAVLAILSIGLLATAITWSAGHLISIKTPWLDSGVNFLIGILAGIGGWFILPIFTELIAGMFVEQVIDKVERAQYPNTVRQQPPKFWPDFKHDVQFTLWALLLNLLVLPLYFFGIGFIISILLNSYLLGTEFFENAAGYHVGKSEAKKLRKMNSKTAYAGGLLITLLTLIPIINLFTPIFAIVLMVHIYKKL